MTHANHKRVGRKPGAPAFVQVCDEVLLEKAAPGRSGGLRRSWTKSARERAVSI